MLETFKRLKFSVCTLMAIALLSLTACASNLGTIEILDTLVSSGTITEDSLKNIAALRNGSLQKVVDSISDSIELETIEYEVTSVTSELTEEQENRILSAFNNYINNRYASSSLEVSESKLVAYYGTYEGYVIAELSVYLNLDMDYSVTTDYIVSNYYLGTKPDNYFIIGWTN